MADLAKGGRGKRAPYKTTHYRIPQPLKPLCEDLSANYRELVGKYSDPEDPNLINATLSATGGNGSDINEHPQVKALVASYQKMQQEIERLNEEVYKLKSTKSKDDISKAIVSFK